MKARNSRGPWLAVVIAQLLLALCSHGAENGRKHKNLLYHEWVSPGIQNDMHRRAGELLGEDEHVPLVLKGFDREFLIQLRRDRQAEDRYGTTKVFLASEGGKETKQTFDHFYTGHVSGEEGSNVSGTVIAGQVTLRIELHDDTYYLERHYTHDEHTHIMYKVSDVQLEKLENSEPEFCGHSHSQLEEAGGGHAQWVEEYHKHHGHEHDSNHGHHHNHDHEHHHDHSNLYGYGTEAQDRRRGKQRRTVCDGTGYSNGCLDCGVVVVTDYSYFLAVAPDGSYTQAEKIQAVISKIKLLFEGVNEMYRNTVLNDRKGNGFTIEKFIIHDTIEGEDLYKSVQGSCTCPYPADGTCVDPADSASNTQDACVNTLLSSFVASQWTWLGKNNILQNFCLGYLFTNRVFAGGVLGLGYIGSSSAGICGGGANGALSTNMQAEGQAIITRVAEIVLAHELGHNYGARHDNNDVCTELGTEKVTGYVMNPTASDGKGEFDDVFSECSRRQFENQLEQSSDCFIDSDIAICGNLIVEEGEECDCGTSPDVCKEMCCTNAGLKGGCKIASGSVCSPSSGFCCKYDPANEKCEFKSKTTICSTMTECAEESTCAGDSSECPLKFNTNASKACNCNLKNNQGDDICQLSCSASGSCDTSICDAYGLETCPAPTGECRTYCRLGSSGECKLFSTESFPNNNIEDKYSQSKLPNGVLLLSGTRCTTSDGDEGYCSNSECLPVDFSSYDVLQDLLDNINLDEILAWLRENWWVILIVMVGMILIIIIIKLSYRCTRSHSNDQKNVVVQEERRRRGTSVHHNGPIKRNNSALNRLRRNLGTGGGNRHRANPSPLAEGNSQSNPDWRRAQDNGSRLQANPSPLVEGNSSSEFHRRSAQASKSNRTSVELSSAKATKSKRTSVDVSNKRKSANQPQAQQREQQQQQYGSQTREAMLAQQEQIELAKVLAISKNDY